MARITKEKRIAELLNESLLSSDIKDILKKNIKKYPESILDGIAESLSRESVALETLSYELMKLEANSGVRWDELAVRQASETEKFIDDVFQRITLS